MSDPVRTCTVCRIKAHKTSLHRFVWEQDRPVLDENQLGDGRGAYCCKSEKCLNKFLSQKQKWRKTFRK